MKKVVSVFLVFIFIVTVFSACENDKVIFESCDWQLYSVANLNENGIIIAVDEETNVNPDAKVVDVVLVAQKGEIVLKDKTNKVTHMGAYEGLIVTDNTDDYRIFLDGKEGYINVSKTVNQDGTEEPKLIMTIDGYDLYFKVK